MKRTVIFLVLAGALVGCGEAEPPRFVPSAGPGAVAPTGETPGDTPRVVTPPKNIATH